MSFFLVFLAIVLIGATLWAGTGGRRGILRRFRRSAVPATGTDDAGNDVAAAPVAGGESPEGGLLFGGFGQPPANLPPVLLPAVAAPADIDRVRFSLGLRGYRMDQVDQVLDELRDQLAAKDDEVARLRARLAEAERAVAERVVAEHDAERAARPESGT
ncbi:DivIVA domain-containing protein [Pseudarthrobacter sp. DSP2-3-2b1]|uniref:DivIVA domain-containing protein n=1 Tax=Pseudarthrobacter sp. DSP2-3-2b1 TaxID=2804661 RepID=UPI003CE9626E